MFETLINQIDTMTLAEGVHTALFTAFLVGGTYCCCRKDAVSLLPTRIHRPVKRRAARIISRTSPPRRPRRPLGPVSRTVRAPKPARVRATAAAWARWAQQAEIAASAAHPG
jgi:hypothetical protein